ncbi:MAG: hypothetical protein CVV44_02360 [Spirochaetae bacterium HGW-Spirochaetae-1]|nr:MAG: hypothetical protein CVV44_02360 [Spirochaetae bacterium HGW-Spirochaetae-1]
MDICPDPLHMENFFSIHIINIYPYAILPLAAGLLIAAISINAFMQSYRNTFATLVFLFCGILVVWLASLAAMIMTPYYVVAKTVRYVYIICWLAIPPVFFHSVVVFSRIKKQAHIFFYLLYAILAVVLIAGDYVTVELVYFGFFPRIIHPQGIAVMTIYYVTIALSLLILYDEYREADTNTRKNQARLLWAGSTLGFIFAAPETILLISRNVVTYKTGFSFELTINVIIAAIVMILSYAVLMFLSRLAFFEKKHIDKNVKYVILAGILGIPFNWIFNKYTYLYCYGIYPISGIGLIIATLLILYASMKYKLMDMSYLFRRYMLYYVLVAAFMSAYIFIVGMHYDLDILMPLIFIGFLMVFIFNPFYQFLKKISDKLLYTHRFDYQKTIRDISNQLVTVLDYDKLIQLLRESVADVMKASAFTILLYNYETDEYESAAQHGNVPPGLGPFSTSDVTIKLIKLVNREIFLEELVDESGDDGGEYGDFFRSLNAVLIIPMAYKGVLRGILCLGDRETGDIYTQRDVELLQILANQAIIALDNARLYEMAITDELTNLYIIRFFNQRIIDEIISSVRLKRYMSLLMIDIDFFKEINDKYGHQAGDLVLKRIAGIIEEQVRAIDLVARYGGEEFAVILPETNNEMALMVAERIRNKIEDHVFPRDIRITVSIGVSTIDGNKVSPAVEASQNLNHQERKKFFSEIKETVIYHADKALYGAKEQGRNKTVNNGELVI